MAMADMSYHVIYVSQMTQSLLSYSVIRLFPPHLNLGPELKPKAVATTLQLQLL